MQRIIVRIHRLYSQGVKGNAKIRPMNPTVEESFGTKFSKQEIEKIMNPKGFLDPKEYKNYEGVETIGQGKDAQKEGCDKPTGCGCKETPTMAATESTKADCSTPTPSTPGYDKTEYGFKIKGPDPTRYGDWERNGRCFDF
jgi:hypothetical protein